MRKITNCKAFLGGAFDGAFHICDIEIENGRISHIELKDDACNADSAVYVFPGFTDVHVHLREPGFSYKETIKTGTAACAHGGYTTVCAMPNLNPTPDNMDHLQVQLDAIKRDACIRVMPYGCITMNQAGEQLSDMEAMKDFVAGYSDDGKGVQSEAMMLSAMQEAKRLDKIIAAHCEDNALLFGGYIHDGEYAKLHGHKGICSESEWGPIKRDLELVEKVGVKYHVCHISTKESVQIIREAKRRGVNVTCETGPHYLLMDDAQLQEEGRFKMNPPIRSKEDQEALIEGLIDGTIDMIATDHAPHSAEEKSKGLEKSAMGIVGIENAFSLLYTGLVKKGIISLEKLVTLMTEAPSSRFGFESGIKVGNEANLCIFDLDESYVIDEKDFLSMGHATPFLGDTVFGKCKETIYRGETVYKD